MHRLATVHARDNQPTNDQRRHDAAYLNKPLLLRKVRRLKNETRIILNILYRRKSIAIKFSKFI